MSCPSVRLLGSEIGNFAPQKAVEHKELKVKLELNHMGVEPKIGFFFPQNGW